MDQWRNIVLMLALAVVTVTFFVALKYCECYGHIWETRLATISFVVDPVKIFLVSSLITMQNLVVSHTVCLHVPKILVILGLWPPRNMLLPHLCYRVKYRHCSSNHTGVIVEIWLIDPSNPTFQGHSVIGCRSLCHFQCQWNWQIDQQPMTSY